MEKSETKYCRLCVQVFRVVQPRERLCPDCLNMLSHQPRGIQKLMWSLIDRVDGLQGQVDFIKRCLQSKGEDTPV